MMQRLPQVFVSYARDDDDMVPGPEKLPGFVTFLHDYLHHQLKQLGQWRPTLWRDRHGIEGADQFADVIVAELERSDYLLVILSENWLARPWCGRELETFCRRWGNKASARIFVVNKSFVTPTRRPPVLQGQTGYDFFEIECDGERAGREHPFFSFGRPRDERYIVKIEDLARRLWREAQASAPRETIREPALPGSHRTTTNVRPNGRTVYLAQPATDMRTGYDRVAAELRGRGFAVVPAVEIPHDRSAVNFIDQAMMLAEISVHLLGEYRGYAPDEEEPIARLQLNRARRHASAQRPQFRRIVWAPKVLRLEDAPDQLERDPLSVFDKFDQHMDGDKVFGGALTDFVDFLFRYLEVTAPRQAAPELEAGQRQKVLILHNASDTDSAVAFGRVLQQAHIAPTFCASQGTATQVGAYNQKRFRECDQVVVYWASAREGWALAQTTLLSEWQGPERKRKGLVAAAPSTQRKRLHVEFPPEEVDFVLDLTAAPEIGPEQLRPLMATSNTRVGADAD